MLETGVNNFDGMWNLKSKSLPPNKCELKEVE